MRTKDGIPGGGIPRDEEGIMNPETTEDKCPHCASDEEAAEGSSCCGGEDGARHTVRSEEARRKLVNRLSRIEGQIRGIRQMIERDAYCNDVLVQSAAAGAALFAMFYPALSSAPAPNNYFYYFLKWLPSWPI